MPLRPPAGYVRPGYDPLKVANPPTGAAATAGDATASVAFSAPTNTGGAPVTNYYAVSNPGQVTASSVTSPIAVSGLTNGTNYTFTVWAQNSYGPSAYSSPSGSVTPSPPYVEDVFSTWLYTGNGSTQTINNGIDLAGKGGLVWFKCRNDTISNCLVDTVRGSNRLLFSNTTQANVIDSNVLTSFNSGGFTVGTYAESNGSGLNYASWTFREQPKFFDVVTYTGTGSTQNIPHNLGSVPGFIIVKMTSGAQDWVIYHRSLGPTQEMYLNSTSQALSGNTGWASTNPTSTVFTVGTGNAYNQNGATYVAYLFAHDAGGFGLTGADNVISCGSYTGSSGSVNLGYEPQWIMVKRSDSTSDWRVIDNMRGWITGATLASGNGILYPNLSNAELSGPGYYAAPTATGFDFDTGGGTWIYIAIRRGPMKTPTTGTSVFQPVTLTAPTSSVTVNVNITGDTYFRKTRPNVDSNYFWNRLRGSNYLESNTTAAETSGGTSYGFSGQTSVIDVPGAGSSVVYEVFKRAPGFHDVVCYTGTGTGNPRALNHNLTVVPELIIVKRRSDVQNWYVYGNALGANNYLELNTNRVLNPDGPAGTFTPATSTTFCPEDGLGLNNASPTYVAYLFASCPGVSKVGSYTGTGTTQLINCGFTGGARFVMIKRTDSTGDWYVWDTARGMIPANDPYLLLNSTAAEVTNTDFIDTAATGFEISITAPAAINANGGTFIFLAIA